MHSQNVYRWTHSEGRGGRYTSIRPLPLKNVDPGKVPGTQTMYQPNPGKKCGVSPRRMAQRGKFSTFFQDSATTWSGCRILPKNGQKGAFGVILGHFGPKWPKRRIHVHHIGVQGIKEKCIPPLWGEARGHPDGVCWFYCASSAQIHPLDGP